MDISSLPYLFSRISTSFKLGLDLNSTENSSSLYSIVIGNLIERLGVRPSFRLTGELPGEAAQLAQ